MSSVETTRVVLVSVKRNKTSIVCHPGAREEGSGTRPRSP